MFQAIHSREGLRPLRGQVLSYARWAESRRPSGQGVANRECDAARSSLCASALLILAEGRRSELVREKVGMGAKMHRLKHRLREQARSH
ncbi:hypothetical protein CXB36_13690 [Pseudomonas syringae pv. syringae]|nr:hypothetical protein BKC06_018035 [Pseudomonas syringae pv. syringae]POP64551.1 hypothetical protein CXB36_13690 [Pseudomonas syringae pv. syringae]